MIWPFQRKTRAMQQPVFGVYNVIVAQSRQSRFYAEWGVPDTMTGRFDMISLHVGVLFRRLRSKDAETKQFSQELFDLFFKDMDRSLREMGVTDLGVPKRIAKLGELFYGLLSSLTSALDGDNPEALEMVLKRNIYGGEDHPSLTALAVYVRMLANGFEAQSLDAIMAGKLSIPGDLEAA